MFSNIKDVRFGDKTSVKDGILYINRDELQKLVAQDTSFSRVNIELAHPGENLRMVNVHNVVEPRAKMDGSGENFPGVLGADKACRQRTHPCSPRCRDRDHRPSVRHTRRGHRHDGPWLPGKPFRFPQSRCSGLLPSGWDRVGRPTVRARPSRERKPRSTSLRRASDTMPTASRTTIWARSTR